jgi:hypothetical protein
MEGKSLVVNVAEETLGGGCEGAALRAFRKGAMTKIPF